MKTVKLDAASIAILRRKAPDLSLADIYARYREFVRQWLPARGLILKTDLENEINVGFQRFRHLDDCGLDVARTLYLELDAAYCEAMRSQHPDAHVRRGDIRELPFRDSFFIAIVDLSTIDHVHPTEMPRVMAEYHRCLRANGWLLLAVWCTDKQLHAPPPPTGREQYFLPTANVAGLLADFSIINADVIHQPHRNPQSYLLAVVGRKEWKIGKRCKLNRSVL